VSWDIPKSVDVALSKRFPASQPCETLGFRNVSVAIEQEASSYAQTWLDAHHSVFEGAVHAACSFATSNQSLHITNRQAAFTFNFHRR
jgi:hypothetical protein